jgi:hypothetical protein
VCLLELFVLGGAAIVSSPVLAAAGKFEQSLIFIEYNSTDNDLGFHVFLDAEDWKTVKIVNPDGVTIFEASGKGPYGLLNRGLSEMFFEGAEPSLDDVPLDDLLALFPEGRYDFIATKADGTRLTGKSTFSHAIPAGPVASAEVNGDSIVIRWEPVTGPPAGFPNERIQIVGYQVIVDPFQLTLPASSTQVTLPQEFVESLSAGSHGFEVLAIDASGNQTITAGSFNTR